MDHLREEFLFLNEAIACLNSASSIMLEISKIKFDNKIIRKAAIERAVIEYAKPFKLSHAKLKKHKLNINIVPKDHIETHRKIIDMRDQVLAHSDLNIKEPNLSMKTYGKTTVTTIMAYHINPIVEIGGEIKIEETINSVLSELNRQAYSVEQKIRNGL